MGVVPGFAACRPYTLLLIWSLLLIDLHCEKYINLNSVKIDLNYKFSHFLTEKS